MRALRADDLTAHAPRAHVPKAHPSGHDMAIAVALPARARALATAASVAMARVRGHALVIAAMDRGSVTVAAGALVAVDADRVGARSARFVSIT
jgi:hypothetical protein